MPLNIESRRDSLIALPRQTLHATYLRAMGLVFVRQQVSNMPVSEEANA